MKTNPVEHYLTTLGQIHATGAHVAETSFYPALNELLNAVGHDLSPKVRCVINLSNRGAGLPDGGLFSADQFSKKRSQAVEEGNPFLAQLPSRGVIEAKAPSAVLDAVATSEQVHRYWEKYRLVLVTNFREFVLLGRGQDGQASRLEGFTLAKTEKELWDLANHPKKAAAESGDRLLEYLKRVLLHNAPLASPQDVAALLASYAHDARLRIETAELPALAPLRDALQGALGLQFEGEKGERFFRSTLIQTLFYGVFSAWVLWARQRAAQSANPPPFAQVVKEKPASYGRTAVFDWKLAHWLLRVPMLRALFQQVADPGQLGRLNLIEVLDWTAAALNRVDHASFFTSFDEGHAVQYFYEPFLHAFDPALRKEMGVWYTPEEIVRYQVERVDTVLREELNLPDGLADPQVVVLDPCCGTGAYLRAVLRRIATTLRDKGGDGLVAHDLKKAAMERVFGFELMPAPFVIAHLQLGLELETLGAPLADAEGASERVGVYLTNALTGWEPPKEPAKQIAFPGFDAERDAAGKVKREKPILVILGNPPYNAYAGISPEEEKGLVEPYKEGLVKEWGIKKFNLDDLYIRFFRLAEKRIAECGGRGVVSYISNFSYLGDPSFVVARQRFLQEFDSIWIDCLNGDSRQTGKLTPEGNPDPSVFSTEWNREGIRVGTAIGLMVKRARARKGDCSVRFRQFWGTDKRAELESSLAAKKFNAKYELSAPRKDNRWSFRPSEMNSKYLAWPRLNELCRLPPNNGLMEKRGGALIDLDRSELERRMRQYFDKQTSFEELVRRSHPLSKNASAHDAAKARARVIAEEGFLPNRIIRYAVRPFDTQWCYYTGIGSVWNRSRPDLWAQCWLGNAFLLSRFKASKDGEGVPFYFTNALSDDHFLAPDASAFALRLKTSASENTEASLSLPGMAAGESPITANLSPIARDYLSSLGLLAGEASSPTRPLAKSTSPANPDQDQATAELIWYHALSIGYSPAYLEENADGIRQDWPRIPLPRDKDVLLASAALGRRVAALLDSETPVEGVTAGKLTDDLKTVAVFSRFDGKPARPDQGDLDLTAGWGHAGKEGVTMPGRGKTTVRPDGGLDIHLNEVACWRNVPAAVWDFTIGGYQVLKKWLSYRKKPLLGRGLTPDEVRHVTDTARRLAALVAMQGELDANYQAAKVTFGGDAGAP